MKTSTKAQVIKYIKDHGTEGLTGEWTATINGVKVGVCKRTIILVDEYTKFPPFTEVEFNKSGVLDFVKGFESNTYFQCDRRDEVVDKYFKVMEGILNNV